MIYMRDISSLSKLNVDDASLRMRIRKYQSLADYINDKLRSRPNEWGKYQSIFNYEINGIFRQIMEFEKENLTDGREENVYKLKKLFVNRIQKEFLHGEYIVWSLRKPFGYAGDFKIIDDIYRNEPQTSGFDRLYDNYFQMSSISVAVRNRKEDFKRYLLKLIKEREGDEIRIMDLGTGPGRDLFELFCLDTNIRSLNLKIDCIDNDQKALDYAKGFLTGMGDFNFIRENAVRLAIKRDINLNMPWKYDLIYSTGLFDYFDDRIILRLIKNMRNLLKENGILAISDVRDKYSNPSVHFMEWVGNWSLIYRDDESFQQLFIEAGFSRNDLSIEYEQQGIMQYVFAQKHD